MMKPVLFSVSFVACFVFLNGLPTNEVSKDNTEVQDPGHFGVYTFSSKNFPAFHIGVRSNAAYILKGNGQNFKVVQALNGRHDAVSFESTSQPGYFLRHANWLLYLHKKQNGGLYKNDASFYIRNNKFFSGYAAFESCNYPGHFLRHQNYRLKLNRFANNNLFKSDASFKLNSMDGGHHGGHTHSHNHETVTYYKEIIYEDPAKKDKADETITLENDEKNNDVVDDKAVDDVDDDNLIADEDVENDQNANENVDENEDEDEDENENENEDEDENEYEDENEDEEEDEDEDEDEEADE